MDFARALVATLFHRFRPVRALLSLFGMHTGGLVTSIARQYASPCLLTWLWGYLSGAFGGHARSGWVCFDLGKLHPNYLYLSQKKIVRVPPYSAGWARGVCARHASPGSRGGGAHMGKIVCFYPPIFCSTRYSPLIVPQFFLVFCNFF